MSENRVGFTPPSTAPIVGGLLAALIVCFGLVILIRLALRRRRQEHEHEHGPEQPMDDPEKAVVGKRPSVDPPDVEVKSVAPTITIDRTEDTRHSNQFEPKQDDTQHLVPPFLPEPSSTLQLPAKPTATSSDTETQSTSATSFATAKQSPRNSAQVQ